MTSDQIIVVVALGGALFNLFLVHGFEVFQQVSILAREIPKRHDKDIDHFHKGKPFVYWKGFVSQRVGDRVFFSLLDMWLAIVFVLMPWTPEKLHLVGGILLLATVLNLLQLYTVSKKFAAGLFPRWGDWGFKEDGTITKAGWYHGAYATVQTWAILMSFIVQFYWRVTTPMEAFGIGFALAGYLMSWLSDHFGQYTGFALPGIQPPKSEQKSG